MDNDNRFSYYKRFQHFPLMKKWNMEGRSYHREQIKCFEISEKKDINIIQTSLSVYFLRCKILYLKLFSA